MLVLLGMGLLLGLLALCIGGILFWLVFARPD